MTHVPPPWSITLPAIAITNAASLYGLNPNLVAAMVQTESGGQAARTRFEKNFRWFCEPERFAKALGITVETETNAQMISYGLMQIMGGTARGLGYKDHLSLLSNPDVGLRWSCLYFSKLVAKYPTLTEAVCAYNAGTPRDSDHNGKFDNQEYADRVFGYLKELEPISAKPLA